MRNVTPLREEHARQTRNGAEVVVGTKLDETPGLQVLLLFVNGVQGAARAVFFGKLRDLGQLLSEGVCLLGLGHGKGRCGRRHRRRADGLLLGR